MNAVGAGRVEQQWLARGLPGLSLTLCAVAVLVFLCPRLTSLFQYDRAAVLNGELWRLLTCQWTHWNASHVMWDSVMFLSLGALCERLHRGTLLTCVIVSAVLIPVVCAVAIEQMCHYRGLSGLDSALFVLLAVQLIRIYRSRDRVIALIAAVGLGAFLVKTTYECLTGSVLFVEPESAFTPVPLAHIVGGAIGLVVAAQRGTDGNKYHPRADQPDQARPFRSRDCCLEWSGSSGG
jgi:rhomboid family GlyGly-CTERM serine protease